MRYFCCGLLLAASTVVAAWGESPAGSLSADQALARLLAGNARFVKHKEQHPDASLPRRKELEAGQHPIAVILGCADSRVPPELIFDQGLGDLFVVRVAGNVVDDDILGSLEYAVEHLGTKLIMVVGHEKCGAVTAALEQGRAAGHLKYLVDAIHPSVEEVAAEPGDKVHNCVIANARRVARQIRESEPVLKEFVEGKGVKVVAADYALDTGKINLLDASHP